MKTIYCAQHPVLHDLQRNVEFREGQHHLTGLTVGVAVVEDVKAALYEGMDGFEIAPFPAVIQVPTSVVPAWTAALPPEAAKAAWIEPPVAVESAEPAPEAAASHE